MEVHHMCMESEKKIESSSHWNDYLRSKTIHFSLKVFTFKILVEEYTCETPVCFGM